MKTDGHHEDVTEDELIEARRRAWHLNEIAKTHEATARHARAQADAAEHHYDQLKLILQGQIPLDYEGSPDGA